VAVQVKALYDVALVEMRKESYVPRTVFSCRHALAVGARK
jgi:hypothetical protein